MEEAANTDCFLCQKPNCSLKCPKPNCNTYYCSDAHYASHIVQLKNHKSKTNSNLLPNGVPSSDGQHDDITTNGRCDPGNVVNGGNMQSDESRAMYACLPYSICASQKLGRHFVATRDIKPLELVLLDQPGVVGPATKTSPVCIVCLNPASGHDRYKTKCVLYFSFIPFN